MINRDAENDDVIIRNCHGAVSSKIVLPFSLPIFAKRKCYPWKSSETQAIFPAHHLFRKAEMDISARTGQKPKGIFPQSSVNRQ